MATGYRICNVAIGKVPEDPAKLGFRLDCGLDLGGDLIKMQVLIQEIWRRDEILHF